MGGGDTLPGFPHANPTTSYWQLPPHRIANHRTTKELPVSETLDYVIIGSGVSSAAVAYKLLSRDPSLRILMLEARTAASGASGRNGGHCRAGFWLNFKKYVDAFGEDEALKFERLEEENVQDIADFVRNHEVDCDFQDVETADAFLEESNWAGVLEIEELREKIRQRRNDAGPLTKRKVLRGQEAREHLDMPSIVGAVVYPAHTQNPYLLVCRMLELTESTTNTLAIKVNPIDCPVSTSWDVKTERGTVHAKHVVLATNAYINALHPGLAATKFLTPARSQVTAVRPSKDVTGIHALHGSAGIEDLGSCDYFMCRAPGLKGAGDVLYGGGRSAARDRDWNTTDDSMTNPDIAAALHHNPAQVFRHDIWGDNTEVVRDWSGITCYTPDSFPLVGEAPGQRGLWMSVGMNGHGMAMAFRSAEALVQMMTTGNEPEWFPKPFRIERAFRQHSIPTV